MIRVGKKYQHLVHGGGCACHSPQMGDVTQRLTAFNRRGFLAGLTATAAAIGLPGPLQAQAPGQLGRVLFRQLRLFDGKADSLRDGAQVLVEGNRIASVDFAGHAPPADAKIIDCGGRVMTPGLIDAHWHTLFAALPLQALLTADAGYIYLAATVESRNTLLRGFTTVRDLGGPVFPFKQAIDDGLIVGPRIYPSGPMITTTGGHGDMRALSDLPRIPGGPLSAVERTGGAAIADNIGEVQLRVREQLLQGASQLKLVAGGGVSSPRSPLDMTTFSEAELRSAVDVARDWNTYVAAHAYAPRTIKRAIAAGAACIEHAHLMDEEAVQLMAAKGVWLSIQPFLSEEDVPPMAGPSREKALEVIAATPRAYELARKHGIKTAFGSDLLFSATLTPRQGKMLTHLTRWHSNAGILKMATSTNAELLALSGERNPYPGKLGVIEAGAYADLLIVDGNPLENIDLIATPEKSLALIMKNGAVVKNALPA